MLKIIAQHNITIAERFQEVLELWLLLNDHASWMHLEVAITNARRETLGLDPLTDGKSVIKLNV